MAGCNSPARKDNAMNKFNEWLNILTQNDTDFVLEMDLILEFVAQSNDTKIDFFEWFDNHNGNTDQLHDILSQAGRPQKVEYKAWISQREYIEFEDWLKSQPNQNYDYAERI
jgi:hypothetical protein